MDDPVLASWPDLAEPADLPAHARIAGWLERLIVSRELQPGDRLPSEVEIAQALGVSRMTLRQALAGVEAKGMLQRRRGRFGGNFVARPRVDYTLSGLPGFTEQMRRASVEAGARVVRAGTGRPTAQVREALGLKRGRQVHEVVRVRSADGEPVTLEETHLPADLFPGILDLDLTGSLYRVMDREFGRAPASAVEVIEPVKADPEQAELLGVAVDDALLRISRTAYAADGTAVEFSRDLFRPDRTRITLRSTVDGPISDDPGVDGPTVDGRTVDGSTDRRR